MTDENRVPEEPFELLGDADDRSASAELGDAGVEDPAETDEEDFVIPLASLDVALAERDEYLDALRRLQAEFDNYRKRVVRQQTELLERASQALVERLLPVLDGFDLAIAHARATETDSVEMASTLERIESLLRDVLAKEGLERIDASGVEFDPTVHDAVARVPAEELDEAEQTDEQGEAKSGAHLVDEVMRTGYRLKGRVLRPAMVRVRG